MALSLRHAKARQAGLGGSDIGAIIGANPWRTAGDVWADKVGIAGDDDAGEAAHWGSILETPVRKEYERRNGVRVRRLTAAETPMPHPDHPIILASMDGLVLGGPDETPSAVYEGKCSGFWGAKRWGADESDDVPLYVLAQGALYVAVAATRWGGIDRCDFALLDGGALRFRQFTYHRDMELEGTLIEAAEKFWRDHVETEKPPPPTESEKWKGTFARWWPEADVDLIPATSELDQLANDLAKVRDEESALKSERTRLENAIKAAIEDHGGIEGDGWKATWKYGKAGAVSWKRVAEAVGADKRADLIEKSRGAPARTFRFTVMEG